METADGCELWTETSGAGDPLVVCHGGPGLWDMFANPAQRLSQDMRVIRWDQRGGGRSERRGPYSVARMIADLDAVREHHGLETMVLLGHSWGARLALHYALTHPGRVSRLVYVSGTGLGGDWHTQYERNLAHGLGEHYQRWAELSGSTRTADEEREFAILQWSADFCVAEGGFTPETALERAREMTSPWFGINYECNAAINAECREIAESELVDACRVLTVPTLIIEGARDIRPRWAVDSLAEALPKVTRVSLPMAGHLPWTEAPAEFHSALMDFLRPG